MRLLRGSNLAESRRKYSAYITGLSLTTVTLSASNVIEFDEIQQNKGCYAIQGHSGLPMSVEVYRSIILYLRPLSLESLLSLRAMMLSGFLLRLLSDAMKEFIQSQFQVRLVVCAEDFKCCLRRAAGRCESSFLQFLLLLQTTLLLPHFPAVSDCLSGLCLSYIFFTYIS